MVKFLIVFGTRPEAIKLAPVIKELKTKDSALIRICVTAQHRDMLDQVLNLFEITPDYDLNVMIDNQTPTQVASSILSRMESILNQERPDWVIVQGDTTTMAAAAIAAFYARVKVGHVEAGLRTFDKSQPFPEEMNRKIAGAVADLHFAPTEKARQNLLREGVDSKAILVTGNSVIDALHLVAPTPFDINKLKIPLLYSHETRKIIFVTAHRRENFGKPLEDICMALAELARLYQEKIAIIYTVHRNPNIWDNVHKFLSGISNIALVPPLDYLSTVNIMKRSYLILTDSGGIQEEGPSLGKPVLVLRNVTERPEAVEAGTVKIVGTEKTRIINEVAKLIEDHKEYERMALAMNPYGDGKTSQRIASALLNEPIVEFVPAKRL